MRGGALLLLLFAALLIGGCGGGGERDTTSGEAAQEEAAAPPQAEGNAEEPSGLGEGDEGDEEGEPSHAPNPPIATERTPGSKAVAPGVPITKGGDNSIQAFGTEGEEEEAEQALAAFEQYLQARIAGDWQAACDAASQEFRDQLAMLVERAKAKAKDAQKPQGCPETLSLLYGKAPKQALREAAAVKQLLSFRVREDGYAYLIYESETGEAKFIAMANEDGAWRVNTPEPTGFPQTEGQESAQ